MTVWSMLEECVSQLDEPFRRSEIIGWFRRHHPDVNEATLAAHIQAATANAANPAQNNPLGARAPLLQRIDHGLYVRAERPGEPAAGEQGEPSAGGPEAGQPAGADVILVGCVRTKKAVASAAAWHADASQDSPDLDHGATGMLPPWPAGRSHPARSGIALVPGMRG